MQNTKRKKAQAFDTDMEVTKYLGRNSWGNHSALPPSESREIINWDIFAGEGDDYLRSRRGSCFLRAADAPTKRGSTAIAQGVTWDVGSEEYLITQEGVSFYAQALLTPGSPVLIAAVGGGTFTVASSLQADMFVSGDKLYIFHAGGNKLIEWNEDTGVFEGLPAGLSYPYILAVTSANAGVITGSYTLGIEKVYQVDGVDRMASTPNRKTTGRILAVSGTVTAKKLKATLQATELDNDSLWTHLRVWRSKNKNVNLTDPSQPIDAQGNDDELYEEALITRAEMGVGSLTSIATGTSLPVGNAGTQAGKPGSVYTIEVNNADAVLFNLIELDQIELLPIPAARVGCFHAKRIFVSNIEDSTLDDRSRNNIYYSSFAGTKYACQYNPLNIIETGRDGEAMMRLISFEKDLIGIKEKETGRLPGGNVDLAFEIMDQGIGISDKNLCAFIPAVGIAAITNDYKDFRIFGYDLRWTKVLNGLDISTPVRVETSQMEAGDVSFLYSNGKVMISDGTGRFYALHEKEKRGWTAYDYLMDGVAGRAFNFANGTRAAVVSPSTYLMEIEVEGLDTDDNAADDTQENYFELSETTYRFQSGKGADIVEHEYLSVEASLSATMTAVPYLNGLPWPLMTEVTETDLTPSPNVYAAGSGLQDREYRLYIAPATIVLIQWGRMAGNYLHYTLTTTSPAVCRSKRLRCAVDQDGMSFGSFDPFQNIGIESINPVPAQGLIDGGYEDEAVTSSIDGGYEDETITDSIDGGYSA